LNKEIASAGVPFDVGELGSVRAPYPEIVPLLTRHLMLDYSRDVLGAIIAAMTVPYGDREALDALLGVLHEKRNSGDRDILFSVGNAPIRLRAGVTTISSEAAWISERRLVAETPGGPVG